MWIRLRSGIILVLLLVLFLTAGREPLLAALWLISTVGLYELYRTLKIEKQSLALVGYGTTVLYYICIYLWGNDSTIILFLLSMALIAMLAIYVTDFPNISCEQMMVAYVGIFYVPVMLSFIYLTRNLSDGIYLVWLIFLCSWGCDTCAYCAGRTFGRHKMAPVLSPKKTWEGAVGGMAGAMLLGALFGALLSGWMSLTNPILSCAVLCGAGALISMIGDMAASAIKRQHKIKDYGNLIPGHGGILDRFDSVIFTAPVIYYIIRGIIYLTERM